MSKFLKWLLLSLLLLSLGYGNNREGVYTIKYLTAENVYLDGGKIAGIQLGDTLVVRRSNQLIAELIAAYVVEYSTSCRVLKKYSEMKIGDNVYLKNPRNVVPPKAPPIVSEEKVETTAEVIPEDKLIVSARRASGNTGAKVSGSISTRLFRLDDQSENNMDFLQPTVRLNLRIRNIWGKDYNFRIRTRTRYNQRSRGFNQVSQTEWRNRVYEAAFSFDDRKSRLNYRLGRLISNYISGVGYLDGLQLQHNFSERTAFGILAGTQPDWRTSNFQTEVQKYGAYLNFISGDYSNRRLETTVAGAAEYHSGTVSREFLFLQNSFNSRGGFYFYQSAELDINRDWRREKTGESVSFSNLFLSARYKFNRNFSVGLTFDNRQNYWTYEVRSLSDSLFDDALRTGLRANVSIRLPGNYRLYANGGFRKKQTEAEATYSFAGGLSQNNFLINNLSINVNGAGFSNTFTEGVNGVARLGTYLGNANRLELSYGIYSYRFTSGNMQRDNYWVNTAAYFTLLRRLFFSGQFEINWGDDLKGQRIFLELGYRF